MDAQVKTSQTFLIALSLTLALSHLAVADQPHRGTMPRAEKVARASWTPVRDAGPKAGSTVQASSKVARAQAVEEIPPPAGQRVPTPVPINGMPGGGYLDGPIMDEPVYGGMIYEGGPETIGVACDSMVCDGGCDGCGGIGCDSIGHCDSIGCAGGCVGGHGWFPCLTLCAPRDGWVSVEYLNWYQRGMYLPALATRNLTPAADGSGDSLPNLATTGTSVVYGDGNDYLDGSIDGFRLGFGFFLDRCHEWSVAADYFGWDQINEGTLLTSGTGSLGRPIFLVEEGSRPAAELVDFNGNGRSGLTNVTGTLGIDIRSQLQSGGVQFRRFLVCRDGCGDTVFMNLPAAYRSRIDLGVGYRYTQLEEGLGITERLTPLGSPAGSFINVFDQFDTQTQFNGFDFGIFYTRQRGLWSLDLQGRFAIGTNKQKVTINGATERQLVGTDASVLTGQGGLLALTPGNIGTYSRDRISVLPEFRANLGYQVTPNLRATVGYTFMYWSNVVRPGDQVDLDVNTANLPFSGTTNTAAVRPAFQFNETDYWAQGISFGGEYRW
jgi:hypothetical protein